MSQFNKLDDARLWELSDSPNETFGPVSIHAKVNEFKQTKNNYYLFIEIFQYNIRIEDSFGMDFNFKYMFLLWLLVLMLMLMLIMMLMLVLVMLILR